jgi:phage-related protein
MELFKIFATIAINNSDANRHLDETAKKGQKTQSALAKVFSGIGKGAAVVGKTVGVGLAAGATAMVGLTTKAMQAAGSLEQQMGGSKAVFGEYADDMQEKAKKAFSSMGLSTNDYLQTANKMGSLFKGAGFETKEAMDLTSKAMQRASDVASIMGIDTSMAMESIAGAAKGNFTMMDNLGVAMNDTTLQAYALEKGIEKSTREMTNQEKIGLAMEMFLEKTADYAGNYAKENETLAGSLGTAKAAFQNFLDGSGDVDSLVTTFSGAIDSMVKQLENLLPRLVSGLTDIVNKLAPKIPPLIQKIAPTIVQGAISLVQGLVNSLPVIIDTLLASLPLLIDGVGKIFEGIIAAFPQLVQKIVDVLPSLIPQIVTGLVSMAVTLASHLPEIIIPVLEKFPEICESILQSLSDNFLPLLDVVVQPLKEGLDSVFAFVKENEGVFTGLAIVIGTLTAAVLAYNGAAIAKKVIDVAETVYLYALTAAETAHSVASNIAAVATTAFGAAMSFLTSPITLVILAIGALIGVIVLCVKNWDKIKEAAVKGWEDIKKAWGKAVEWFKGVWDGITKVFSKVGSWFGNQFKQGKENAQKAWSTIANFFKGVWSGIQNVFAKVGSWFKNQFEQGKQNAQKAWSTVKNFFSTVWSGIKNVFANVVGWFRDKFNSAKNGVQNAWSGVKNFFSNIKNGIVNAFSNVKEKLSAPFTKARDTIKKVADKIKGFFKGEISMPKIKLPRFSITPAGWKVGDLLKGVKPKLGITWAAKGGIFDEPTLLNTPTGMLGVGEAGAEAVAPIDVLMGYVQTAVKTETSGLADLLERIIELLVMFFPQILEEAGRDIVLDDGTLVSRLAPKLNLKLKDIRTRNERGG